MHSSTFSSERVPQDHGNGVVAVTLAAALSLSLLAAVELGWRIGGARASYVESPARWAMLRERIERSEHPRRTAILGASRALFNLSLETFSQRHPEVPVAQLAIAARGPLATLEDFAYHSRFGGLLLLEFDPDSLLPPRDGEQAGYLAYYRTRWTIDQSWNLALAGLVEPWLVTRHANYGVNQIVRNLLARGRLPAAALYLTVRETRQHDADYALANVEWIEQNRRAELASRYRQLDSIVDKEWPRTLSRLVSAVAAVHARGGCVVLVKMPAQGAPLQYHQQAFGSASYWSHVLKAVGAYGLDLTTAIDTLGLQLADSMHLDHADQSPFTHLLLDYLDALAAFDSARACHPSASALPLPVQQ